jgi:hypothetical protein
MFGRTRRRQQSEARRTVARIEALESEASLTEALTVLERTIASSLREVRQGHAATESVVEHLWYKVVDQEHQLTRSLAQVAQLCELLVDRLEGERLQQGRLATVLEALAAESAPRVTALPARERVIGGTVRPGEAAPLERDVAAVELVASDDQPLGTGDLRQRTGWQQTR